MPSVTACDGGALAAFHILKALARPHLHHSRAEKRSAFRRAVDNSNNLNQAMASDRIDHPCGGTRYAFPPYDYALRRQAGGGAEMCRYLCPPGEGLAIGEIPHRFVVSIHNAQVVGPSPEGRTERCAS